MDQSFCLSEYEFPFINPEVHETKNGVRYFQSPGIAVVSAPLVDLSGIQKFLDGFPNELKFIEYLDDPVSLSPTEKLVKFAGQLCYLAFGPMRTFNNKANVYFDNIKIQGHGSLMEHANFSVLWWGVSRSLTHELVRHRAGFGFSQVSQRYVGGSTLRFVERPEFQDEGVLHQLFLDRIESTSQEYERLTGYLLKLQKSGEEKLSAERETDLRKKVRQASRAVLRNETEAPVLITANIRSWRHFFNMRASEHAEVEIRRAAFETFRCLRELSPLLLGDFREVSFADGTDGLSTAYPKV